MPKARFVNPAFFVIGAQRAGTTRLCALLADHPNVAIPTKEPMFFQSEQAMQAKSDWYRALYADLPGKVMAGDGSTYYSMAGIYPGTAKRIHAAAPDARIIYAVRHPLRRIESAWAQLLSVGHANRVQGFDRTLRRTNLLLDPSLYWRQLAEYRRVFPDEQIHVLCFEDFERDEAQVVTACWAFLGVRSNVGWSPPSEGDRNASADKRQRSMVVDALRLLPGYERHKRLVPESVKSSLSRVGTSTVRRRVVWRPETLTWVVGQLSGDTAAMLDFIGRPQDFWELP